MSAVGGGGLSSADIFRIRDFFRCGRPHFTFWRKKFGFLEIYGVFARAREGWASADILRIRGGGSIFCDFCGHPLWTDTKQF